MVELIFIVSFIIGLGIEMQVYSINEEMIIALSLSLFFFLLYF